MLLNYFGIMQPPLKQQQQLEVVVAQLILLQLRRRGWLMWGWLRKKPVSCHP
jgi:hypothetical protein